MTLKFRSTFLVIIATVFLVATSLINAQGTIIPLMQNGWVGGLSGNLGWDNYTINASSSNFGIDSKVTGFNFTISSRNGRFVEDNSVIGFDLQWKQSNSTATPQNHLGSEPYTKERLGFIGLWMRYYVPFIGTGWAIFPEASFGYGNFKSITDELSLEAGRREEASADGFVYNVGLGATIFVSNNIAFEATGRYQGGKLKGDYVFDEEVSDNLEIKLSNIDVLFGIMIYMR
ncbi:hypothetical protein MNBD_IGNAVI01-2510 [hydrothermal vent metagenome]|uniref:Uncharacterized protein n=1 Tax=hydrothermal vent metagenome TaxID=652676 RepID=A0A3B1CNT1_9ZZZZ